jgi:hypothetical protein
LAGDRAIALVGLRGRGVGRLRRREARRGQHQTGHGQRHPLRFRRYDPSSILAVNHRLQSASGRSSGWRKSGDAIVGEGAAGLQ